MSDNHGNSPAAWTGVAIIILAFVIAAVGLMTEVYVLAWVALVLVPVGVLVWMVMAKASARRA